MIDLIIHNGDLALQQSDLTDGTQGETNYHKDLALKGREAVLMNLLRRAVETPITHIGRYVVDNKGVRKLDLSYGNGIYLELSEPVTLDWVKRAEDHIRSAVSFLPTDIKITSLNISPDGFYSARIDLRYRIDGGQETTLTSRVSLENINAS
jgi:hypothetical protein